MVSENRSLETEDDVAQINSLGGRKNTPRDLFKLCGRLNDVSKSQSYLNNEDVFFHCIHCFDSSLSHLDGNYEVAFAIGAKLGLSKEKVTYYLEVTEWFFKYL